MCHSIYFLLHTLSDYYWKNFHSNCNKQPTTTRSKFQATLINISLKLIQIFRRYSIWFLRDGERRVEFKEHLPETKWMSEVRSNESHFVGKWTQKFRSRKPHFVKTKCCTISTTDKLRLGKKREHNTITKQNGIQKRPA